MNTEKASKERLEAQLLKLSDDYISTEIPIQKHIILTKMKDIKKLLKKL
jgi:hypothetical protein